MRLFLDSFFIIILILEKDDLHEKSVFIERKRNIINKCYISNLFFE
jgi:hypothetical protein